MSTAESTGVREDRRLSALDAAFLYIEGPTEPLHVGSVAILEASVPFEEFTTVLGARLATLTRYRQCPDRPWLDLGRPTWRDDLRFDPGRHTHHVTVPAPGGAADLHRMIDELFARPLDPRYPLWENYLVDGLAGGRAAVLSKVHHCMIDGVSGAQVIEMMTDGASRGEDFAPKSDSDVPQPPTGEHAAWWLASLAGDVVAAVGNPARMAGQARELLGATRLLARCARQPVSPLPFNGVLTGARRIVWTLFSLDDVLAMRGAAGCKVNDVVLAIIAGALGRYLRTRGVAGERMRVRALVPVSVRHEREHLALGNRVSAMLADLPVDTVDPIARLERVATHMRALKERGDVRAMAMVLDLAGTCPAPAGAWLARLGVGWPLVNTVCTNVPGPRDARRLLGRRVLEIHPIVPIAAGIGLGFAILSYDRTISISATADPGLVPDADRIAAALADSMAELRAALGVTPSAVAVSPVPSPTSPTVGDLMTRDVATLLADDTLAHAWEVMRERRIRHLPVVDRERRLIGLVTHRDLLAASQSSLAFRRAQDRVRLLGWARAADVMETHVSTAAPDGAAAEAGHRMVRQKISCLPVVDEADRLVGIVTEEDYLRWATTHMEVSAA